MSAIHTYKSLRKVVTRLRDDLNQKETTSKNGGTKIPASIILIYAYNRTGKTRLSMEFKDRGKEKARKISAATSDTLYFNAFTEDLFTWENDLDGDNMRYLQINNKSKFLSALDELALDESIGSFLGRYADFDFEIDYNEWKISFRKDGAENIKISRGEQNIFVWCLFMAICERMLDGHDSYQWVKYLYIDDPISSLDDNNAIAVACDLAQILRRAANRKDSAGRSAPIRVIFSTHHALFFNVMCNEIGRPKENEPRVNHKRYFLHRPSGEDIYILRSTEDTPFFHHVATLSELQRAADPKNGVLYTFHFNAMRSIMEKTASFFGHSDISFCIKSLNNTEDSALYNRALNLLSHGKYAIHEPTQMGEDNKDLFRRILGDFVKEFQFSLPNILAPSAPVSITSPALVKEAKNQEPRA